MKSKIILVFATISFFGVAFAEDISALLAEFNRRDAIVLNQDQARVMAFLKGLKYDLGSIVKLELLANPDQFNLKLRNGDDCSGDMQTGTIDCIPNADHGKAIVFLESLKFDVTTIAKLEILANHDRFVLQAMNGDVCLGDIPVQLLRCKNEMGITTIQFSGDSD